MSVHELPPPPEPPKPQGLEADAAPAAEAPSRKPLVVGIVLIVAIVATAVAIGIWISRPSPCGNANVTSSRFGYCLSEPASWSAETSSGTSDQLVQNDGPAVVTIQAISLKTGTNLSGFASQVRESAGNSGLLLEGQHGTQVAGVAASSWDSTSSDGNLSIRDVVFVKGDTGWVLEFTDKTDSFGKDSATFSQMLGTWRFR